MEFKILPLIKTHFSIGKSLITSDKPKGNLDKYPISCFDLCIQNKIDKLIVVEDNVSSLLELSTNAKENNINLTFGLRIRICHDIKDKSEDSLKSNAKYIIFLRNSNGYKDLIKIWSLSATEGFYYNNRIDFKNLKKLWNNDNLKLCVPFYDSFIHSNTLQNKTHVPDFSFTKPDFFIEKNQLLFDDIIKDKVLNYCEVNDYNYFNSQTILYKSKEDFESYATFRCISKRTTMNKPSMDHFSSDLFSFYRWMELNNQ